MVKDGCIYHAYPGVYVNYKIDIGILQQNDFLKDIHVILR